MMIVYFIIRRQTLLHVQTEIDEGRENMEDLVNIQINANDWADM